MIVCVSKQAGRIFIGMKKKEKIFFYVYDALTVAHHVPIGKIIKILRKKKTEIYDSYKKKKTRASRSRPSKKEARPTTNRPSTECVHTHTNIYLYSLFTPVVHHISLKNRVVFMLERILLFE